VGVESEESLMTRYRPAVGSSARARRLRRLPTDAEVAMWRLLRLGFAGARFRKQVPIGLHVADFASHRHKLVIEVDGSQHGEMKDRARTKMIEAAGFRVIRFWNNDVLRNADGVARVIEAALVSTATPTPTLPPQGGGSYQEQFPWPASIMSN
jgi:very-short-patch-repair endonuclease